VALRARELYYFVRVGNFATRPLRALQADFHKLGAAGDQAAARLERLNIQQKRLQAQQKRMVARALSPVGDLRNAQAVQAAMSRQVALQSRLRNSALERSKVDTAIYKNQTTQLDLQHRLEVAQRRLNSLKEEDLATERGITAAHRVNMLTRQLTGAQMAGGDLAGRFKVLDSAAINVRNQIKGVELELQRLAASEEMASAETTHLIRQLNILGMQLAEVEAEQRAVNASMKQQKWDRIALRARAMSDFGRSAQYAGALTVIAFGLMGRAAMKFNEQVTLAATQVGNNFQEVQRVTDVTSKAILDQMLRFPASADEMAKASYQIFSSLTLQGNASEQAAQGMGILEMANKAAVAGLAPLEDVTSAMIVILNQFAKAGKNAAVDTSTLEDKLNTAFAAVRFGQMTFAQFTATLAQASPAAKAFGQTFEEMSGTLAFLSRHMPAKQAAVSFARLTEVLQRAEEGLKKHHISIRNAAGDYRPLHEILGQIAHDFPEVAKNRRSLLLFIKDITKGTAGATGIAGTAQARRGLQPLLRQFIQYNALRKSVIKDNGEFLKSLKSLRATPEQKWKLFVNQLHVLAITVGAEVIPAMMQIIGGLQKAVHWFNSLDQSTKHAIATVGIWGGVALLVGGTLAVIGGTVMRLAAQFRWFEKAIFSNKTVLKLLAGEAGSATTRLAIMLGVFPALIYLMIRFHDQVIKVIKVLNELGNKVGGTGNILQIVFGTLLLSKLIRIGAGIPVLVRLAGAMFGVRTAAVAATPKVAGLLRLLQYLKTIGPIAIVVTVAIVADKLRDMEKRPRNWLQKHLPFLRSIDKFADKFTPDFLDSEKTRTARAMSEREQKNLKSMHRKVAKGFMTLYQGHMYRWTGSKWMQITPKQAIALGRKDQIAADQKLNRQAILHATRVAKALKLSNRSREQWIKLAIRANKAAAKDPSNLAKQIRAAQIMNEIQSRYKGAELEGIQAVINADNKATKKRIKNAQDIRQEAIDNMRQVYDEFQQQNEAAFGSITEGVRAQNAMQFGGIPTGRDLLGDIRDQVKNFERWRNELGKVAGRVPEKLVKQLREAGPSAEPILRGILKMTPKQLKEYVRLWKRGQEDIKKATVVDFNNQLVQWRRHGRKAALQFMRGMKDEGSYINKEMKRIFLNWLHGGKGGLKPDAVSNRPNRNPRNSRNLTVHHTENIHVHNNKEDLSTTLRKTRLHQKNRRANRLNWGVV